MNNLNYSKPSSLPEALQLLDTDQDRKLIAGGTNIIDLLKYFITKADDLIDINHLSGQSKEIVELENGGLRLSAFATNADTAYHPLIESRYPLLSKAILAGASAQIRNMATNGGNLLQRTRCYYFYDPNTPCNKREAGTGCSAIGGYNRIHAVLGTSEHCIAVFPSDMCVALAALDACVNISAKDSERTLPFADFHRLPGDTPELDNNLQPGEIITSIDLPPQGFPENYAYLKLRDRSSYAFALVSVASAFELDGMHIRKARIALGGLAHKPWRVEEAEKYLEGKIAGTPAFEAAADIILRGAIGSEFNAFKIQLAKKAIVRNCHTALQPETQLPGAQP